MRDNLSLRMREVAKCRIAKFEKQSEKSRFYQYEIANEMGITEFALCRWLRYELTVDQKQRILDAISSLRAKADE